MSLEQTVARMLWEANVIPYKVMAVETRWEEAARLVLASPTGVRLRELVEAAEYLRRQGHVITNGEAKFFPDGRAGSRLLLAIDAFTDDRKP